MDIECCRCRFWLPSPCDSGLGECRRFPPAAHWPITQDVDKARGAGTASDLIADACEERPWFFPVTCADSWCGEFRPAEGRP